MKSIRLWDLPTRLFHWGLVFCVVAAYATAKLGGLWMDWHIRFGLSALGLIAFRMAWGIVGPRYARFSHFVRGPDALIHYLKGSLQPAVGHNPLGGLSVLTMLLVFGFQAVSGLFANDDVLSAGPLAHIDSGWSATLTGLHKLNEWVMLALVAMHVGAIAWYQKIRGRNLVGPMIHGDIVVPTSSPITPPPATDDWKVRTTAAVLAFLIGALVWWISRLGGGADTGYM